MRRLPNFVSGVTAVCQKLEEKHTFPSKKAIKNNCHNQTQSQFEFGLVGWNLSATSMNFLICFNEMHAGEFSLIFQEKMCRKEILRNQTPLPQSKESRRGKKPIIWAMLSPNIGGLGLEFSRGGIFRLSSIFQKIKIVFPFSKIWGCPTFLKNWGLLPFLKNGGFFHFWKNWDHLPFSEKWGRLPFKKNWSRLSFWKNWGRLSFLKIMVVFHLRRPRIVWL